MSQNLSSAAVVIGTLKVNFYLNTLVPFSCYLNGNHRLGDNNEGSGKPSLHKQRRNVHVDEGSGLHLGLRLFLMYVKRMTSHIL